MPNNTRSQGGGGGMSDIAAKAEWIVDRVLEKYRTPYIAVDWYKIACAEVAKALQAERDEQKSRAEKMIVYGNSLIEKHDLRASLEKTIGYAYKRCLDGFYTYNTRRYRRGASDLGEDKGGEDISFALIFILVVIFMFVIIPGIPWLFYRFILDVEEDYGTCWVTGFGITCVALVCVF
jgi:hypothetical protein